MKIRRGDVVLAMYPFASGTGASRRPAVVVQDDRDNARMQNTIIAQVTTNLGRAAEPTHLRIDVGSNEAGETGLLHNSVVSCNNLATVHTDRIVRVIGHLSDAMSRHLDACFEGSIGVDLSAF